MTDVLLFHHAQGRTPGVAAFADELRRAGHTVHVPDLYEGRTFDDLQAGIAHAQEVGFDTVAERGERAADELPSNLVYVGMSLGVVPAQKLAQTRPGAIGALLLCGCVPADAFAERWPADVPVQVHGMDADEIFVNEGDLDSARGLVSSAADGELFLYPGDRHLFLDNSLPSYDGEATRLLTERVLAFLDRQPG
ncbi:MAG: dienelactone hydrolase family protein [Nocardioidaceae bacterium]